jgi:hypothetical protein
MYHGDDNPNLLSTFYNNSNILKLTYLYYYLDHNDLVRLLLSCKEFYKNKNLIYNLIFQQLMIDKTNLQIYKNDIYFVLNKNMIYNINHKQGNTIFSLLYINNTFAKKAEKSKSYKIKLLLSKRNEIIENKQENNIF